MTTTDTAPETVGGPERPGGAAAESGRHGPLPPPAAARGPLALLSTGDHKALGIAYLVTALLFLLVGLGAGGVLQAEAVDEGVDLLERSSDLQVYTLHTTVMVFLFLAPAFVGLATYLVPLQVGTNRLAFPRLHALAYWLYLGGGVLVCVSYLVEGGPFASRALLAPVGGATAGDASRLWILGMGLVAIAAVLAAVDIVVTGLLRRAPGMNVLRMPAFSWSAVAGAAVTALAVPVFLGGLVLLYVDVTHGGSLFAEDGGIVIQQHLLWLYGRPELYALLLPAAGVVSEVVVTMARRPSLSHQGLLALVGAAAALTFLVWVSSTEVLDAALLPTFSLAPAAVFAPLGLIVLIWLGTLAQGRPRPTPALAFALGFVLSLATAGAAAASAAISDVDSGTRWAASQAHLLLFAGPLFALLAAVHYWAPKMFGRHLSAGLGYLEFLLVLVGAGLAFLPGYTGVRDQARLDPGATFESGWEAWNAAGAAGAALLALGVLLFALDVAVSVLGRRGRVAADDPWEAGSLEWLTTSPPPPYNFEPDTVPEIRSERPVADLRAGEPVGAGSA